MGRQRKAFNHLSPLPLRDIHGETPPRGKAAPNDVVESLAKSLSARGQQQPIVVAEGSRKGMYRVIVGKKRLLAARQLGWPTVDGIVLGRDFAREVGVIERLQKDEFDPFELAETLGRLKTACDWTQAHLGQVIGKTRDFVANILAINDIQPEVRRYVQAQPRPLTSRHLRYIAREAPPQQMSAARRIVSRGLSTKALEQEKRSEVQQSGSHDLIRVRALRRQEQGPAPETVKEWRRYARQLATDLRRVERRERLERKRAQDLAQAAKQRQRTVRREAAAKRRLLHAELHMARRQLAKMGDVPVEG